MSDLVSDPYVSIFELSIAFRDKKVLPSEVMEAQLKRIELIDQKLGSYQSVYKDRNFVVLGFPCNQFGGQEPGTDEEIGKFCDINYSVTFPIFSKIKVNGPDAHPLFKLLKSDKPGIFRTQSIKWNFTKFLINNNGKIVERFSPRVEPKYIRKEIEKVL